MFSHQRLVAPSFRWLLVWAVLLVFGAGGTAYGQSGCPGAGGPPPIGGLGAGPGNTDRSFGYTGAPNFDSIQPTMVSQLLNRIGVNIPAPGEIRAIAVQTFPLGDQRFVIGGNFTYRDPVSGITYRNLMRLRAQQQPNPAPPPFYVDDRGVVDTTFTPLPGQLIPVVNALAVDSSNRIVVGCETPGGTTPPRHVFRLLPGGGLDGLFLAPAATAAVLAVEVDPLNNVYVGLNGGTIGGRQNFTRLTPGGVVDPLAAWTNAPTSFQTGVNGPVRAIKYAPNLLGTGIPGIVVGGSFTQASGSTLNLPPVDCQNVMVFATTGDADPTFLFQTTLKGFDAPVNAIAVSQLTGPGGVDDIFVGGEFANCVTFAIPPNVARPRVAKFRVAGLSPGLDTLFNPPTLVISSIPNPVRALVLTSATNTAVPPFARLHVGGQETATAFGDVALSVTTGGFLGTLSTTSPFLPANPAVVRAMAANATFLPAISPVQPPGYPAPPAPVAVPGGAIFGGAFLNNAQKLVATFNSGYTPPSINPLSGLPQGLPGFEPLFGPTQFYASALLPSGELLIGGDVGVDGNAALPASPEDIEAVLYRIDTCGNVSPVARFRNVPGYLVRNDIDNGNLVLPPQDINATPGQGFRRVDVVDPPSIRAIAVTPDGKIYVGGQFNQVLPPGATTPVPWNNLVRLNSDGTIDPLFQVGQDDPNPPPGYTPIRKGGPTGFGAPGFGFTTVDPERIVPTAGTCNVAPAPLLSGTGEKFNPNEGRVNAIVLQPDGKVLIGGEFKCYNEVPRGGIARLTATGSLDPTFGDSSFSLPGVGDYLQCGNPLNTSTTPRTAASVRYERARVNAILLEPDGKVVVGGLFARANNVDRYNIARFNSDGTLDTGFSQGPTGSIFPTGTSGLGAAAGSGVTSNGRGGEIFALGRQSLGANAGRILIGGAFNRILNQTGGASNLARTAFTRLEIDGRHDATFAQLNFTAAAEVRAIAVKADDRPLIGGPFLIGNRNLAGTDGIGYISNTTRARIHRTGVNGTFTDALDAFNQPRATFLAVPPGVGQNPNAPLVFQPGPYAVSLPAGFGGFPPVPGPLGSLASIFAQGSTFAGVGSGGFGTSEISYYPNLPFNTTPPFGLRFLDTRMTVNTITLDPARRRAYIGGLFNTFESVRADFQNDSAGAPNGLGLDIRWPGVAALQNGSGCSYGLVLPSFPPFQPIPAGTTVNLGFISPAGTQITLASMTRSVVSLCDLQPTVTPNNNFITVVGVVPKPTNPAFVDIIINIAANNTGVQRSGSVTVGRPVEGVSPSSYPTVTFTFDQNPLPSGCTYTVTASQTSFPLAGGTGQFSINTGTGCPWSVGTLPSWISASPTSGFGNGTVNFTVAANSGAPRSATVTVAGQNFTITQAGTCTLTLGPVTGTLLPIPVTGGTGSFTVTTSAGCTYTATSSAPWLVITGGASGGPTGTVTFSVGRNSGAPRSATITVTTTGTPPQTQTVTVSQNADIGPSTADTVGMFRPSNGFFYLRFSNTSGNADIDFFYGTANDVPLSGDWNADGITTIGIFRNGQFFLRNSNSAGFADVPAFAIDGTQPGDIPVAGDWDGNGSTTVGLFRAGVFLLRNSNTPGPADIVFNYTLGVTDQLPLVGDWDGDGVTTVGLFRTSTAFFALRNTNSSGTPDLQFFFGNPNDVPVAGDWNGNGFTTIGVFRTGTFFLRNSNSSGPADLTVNYGVPTDRPVIGRWQ